MIFIVFTIIFFALLFDKLNIFLYLIVSSVLHETGHIAACLIFKNKPKIKVSLFGIKLYDYPTEKNKKLVVLLSGPIVNIILILISYFCFLNKEFSLNIYVFMCVNAVILIFNSLPIQFLDGGQILTIFCSNDLICKIAEIVSITFIICVLISFAQNIYVSISAIILFFFYCFIIKNDLQ